MLVSDVIPQAPQAFPLVALRGTRANFAAGHIVLIGIAEQGKALPHAMKITEVTQTVEK